MNLEHLKALLGEFPEAQIAALVDISSGIVLCVSARDKQPQERLDALCETATDLLVGQTASAFADALEFPHVSMLKQSVVASKSHTTVFLKLPVDTSEALIVVCTAEVDTAKLLEAAKAIFNAETARI